MINKESTTLVESRVKMIYLRSNSFTHLISANNHTSFPTLISIIGYSHILAQTHHEHICLFPLCFKAQRTKRLCYIKYCCHLYRTCGCCCCWVTCAWQLEVTATSTYTYPYKWYSPHFRMCFPKLCYDSSKQSNMLSRKHFFFFMHCYQAFKNYMLKAWVMQQ